MDWIVFIKIGGSYFIQNGKNYLDPNKRAYGDKDEVSLAVLRMDSLPGVGERQGSRREGGRADAGMPPNKCGLQEQNPILGWFPTHTLVNLLFINAFILLKKVHLHA